MILDVGMARLASRVLFAALAPALAPASPGAVAAALEIDVSELSGVDNVAAEYFHAQISKELTAKYDVSIVEADRADAVLRVKFKRDQTSLEHWTIEFTIMRDGTPRSLPAYTCTCYVQPDVKRRVFEVLPDVAKELREQLPLSPQAATSTDDHPTVLDVPAQPSPRQDEQAVGGVGWTGIVMMPIGVATLTAGAVFLTNEDEQSLDRGNDSERQRTTTRPLGVPLITVGGLVAVTGAVLVIVDQLYLRPKRRNELRGSVAWTPSFGPGGIGWAIQGRF